MILRNELESLPDRRDITRHTSGLLIRDRYHPPLTQLFNSLRIFPQIQLGTDQDERNIRCMVTNLGIPLPVPKMERKELKVSIILSSEKGKGTVWTDFGSNVLE